MLTQDTGRTPLTASDTLLVVYSPLVPAVAQSPNVGSLRRSRPSRAHRLNTSTSLQSRNRFCLPICWPWPKRTNSNTASLLRPVSFTPCDQAEDRPDPDHRAAGRGHTERRLSDRNRPDDDVAKHDRVAVHRVRRGQFGDSLTPLVQFINRQQGTLTLINPTVPIQSVIPGLVKTQLAARSVPATFPAPVTSGNLLVVVAERQHTPWKSADDHGHHG